MTAFKRGDKVLIPATVDYVDEVGDLGVRLYDGLKFEVTPTGPEPVTLVPYVDPELVPDMVVMSKDKSDDRMWHYLPADPGGPGGPGGREVGVPFCTGGRWFSRGQLPERIRPVFDPREVTP